MVTFEILGKQKSQRNVTFNPIIFLAQGWSQNIGGERINPQSYQWNVQKNEKQELRDFKKLRKNGNSVGYVEFCI